jgi:FixJ family two-component response regulator
MHGLELKRRLVETGRAIPIILLSARATVEEERPEWWAGAADILRKPIRKETLLQAIQLALESPAH